METACTVYTKLMFQRGLGYPLWEPEPSEGGEVLIGDIGYILDGGFYRLFNATLPREHPVNQRCRVPDDYEPFVYPEALLHRRPRALEPKPLCSKHVTAYSLEGSLDVGLGNPGVSGGVRFKFSEDQGAVLVLKSPGNRETLHPCRDLVQYIVQNHPAWYSFATDVCRLDVAESDIIFVAGFIKTAEWALAAATQRARECELTFGGNVGPLTSATFSISSRREAAMSVEHRTGPHRMDSESRASDDEVVSDQCVFLHYYKFKRRKILSPKVIRAAGGPARSPSSEPPDSPSGSSPFSSLTPSSSGEETERVPLLQSRDDPLDSVLDSVLNMHDNLDCMIACDKDLQSLGEDTMYVPDAIQIPELLSKVQPQIVTIGGRAVGMLPFLAESYHEGTGGLAISTTTTAGSQHYVRQTTRPLAVSPTSFRSPRRHTPSFDRLRSQSIFRPRSVTSRNSPSRSPSVRNPTLRCPTSRSPSLGFPSYIPRGPVFLSGTALESSSNATGEESEGLVMEELEGSESEDEWDETYVHEPRGRPQAPKPGLSAARPKPSTSRVSHK